jgi:hypothetical protein
VAAPGYPAGMAKRKNEPRPVYVDSDTGELREVGEEPAGRRPKRLAGLRRAAEDAVVRRTSTKR